MNDVDIVQLFTNLKTHYPHAAAGLLEDLCSKIGRCIHSAREETASIDALSTVLAKCFRPMDASPLPESIPWDTAYAVFGQWLMRNEPQYTQAVEQITGWTSERISKCKADYANLVRCNRDDWVRSASQLSGNDPR